jgi:DNA (cytosine-5)-methyltransferase 3A
VGSRSNIRATRSEITHEKIYNGELVMAIKILIGGSPCTYWSIAQKNNRETEASGMGWELFKNYLIAKEKFKPDFFLYENNKSAAQAIKDQIADEFGVGVDPNVRFTYINSALVSAQNRQRFYVTNFGDIEQPEDRGILLKDILETGRGFGDMNEKTFALTATYGKGDAPDRILEKHPRTMVAEPVEDLCPFVEDKMDKIVEKIGYLPEMFNPYNSAEIAEKAPTLTTGCGTQTNSATTMVIQPVRVSENVAEPIRVGALPRPNGELSTSRGFRIYSPEGKSVTLKGEAGGAGGKTGLCAIKVDEPKRVKEATKQGYVDISVGDCVDLTQPNSKTRRGRSLTNKSNCLTTSHSQYEYCGVLGYATPCEWDENGIPTKAVSCADGKTYTVYEVKDGQITIKGKQYPIKLLDGYYIIRKLTVTECARLQTMPDDYCKAVSDSQAYKALGNGWAAEVIIHLLNHALKDVPRDEEIIVLSMYDGIATGRYCLDKMGFTNVTYHAYEIDKYPIMVAMDNYPDIIQHGDAFAVREDDWQPPQTRSEWLDELLGGDL